MYPRRLILIRHVTDAKEHTHCICSGPCLQSGPGATPWSNEAKGSQCDEEIIWSHCITFNLKGQLHFTFHRYLYVSPLGMCGKRVPDALWTLSLGGAAQWQRQNHTPTRLFTELASSRVDVIKQTAAVRMSCTRTAHTEWIPSRLW